MKRSTIYSIRKNIESPGYGSGDSTSGVAGVAHWLNGMFGLKGEDALDKKHPGGGGDACALMRCMQKGGIP